MTPACTLDSWAVLHLLQGGANASIVEESLETAFMSWINVGEVSYIVRRRHGDKEAEAVVGDLRRTLSRRLLLPDESLVLAAAQIKAGWPLAYADAFAAATAMATNTTLLTGDPELLVPDRTWRALDLRN